MSGSRVSFDTLLAHEPFLRRLAWGLVGEQASVDDLVQDTLVAAVEHPPPARGLRAWLATVLRNRARERWRREQRRRKREAEASKPELTVPLADRDRVRERIVRAVLELAEPYRTAVLLRYLDGLKPREIAARLDVPVETVRTRVKRGLKLLRDRLEDEPEFAVGWSLALVALVDRPVRRGAGAGTALMGILVMNAKLIIVTLIVAAATLIAWQAWPASPAPPRAVAAERPDASPEAPSDGASAIEPNAGAAPPADPASRVVAAPVLLRGKLIPAPGTAPGVAVLSVYKPGHTPEAEIVRGQTRNDLTFEFDVGPLARQKGVATLLIQVDHPAHMPAVVSAVVRPGPEIEPVVVSLSAAAIIQGQVTEQGGAPVPRARVAVFEWDGAPSEGSPIERVRTDDEGRYRLRTASGGTYFVAAVGSGLAPAHALAVTDPAAIRRAPDLVLRPGLRIEGHVLFNSAPPREWVVLRAQLLTHTPSRALDWQGLGWLAGRLVRLRTRLVVHTTDKGRFRFGGLDETRHRIEVVSTREVAQALWEELPTVEADAPAVGVRLDIALSYVRFRLRDGERPVGGQHVLLGTRRERNGARLDERGELVRGFLPGAEYVVKVAYPPARFQPIEKRFHAPAAGRTEDLVLALEPRAAPPKASAKPTLAITVRTDDGSPPPRIVGVGLWNLETTESTAYEDTDVHHWKVERAADGTFHIRVPKPGHYRVAVRPGGWLGTGSHLLEAVTEVRVPAGAPLTNAVVHTRRGGRLRLVARSPGGRALEARCIIRDAAGQRVATEFHRDRIDGWWGMTSEELSDGLTDLHPPLLPDIYTVEFSHDDFATVTKTVRVDRGVTTTVEATLATR